jgi:hypothetical protein
MLLNRIEALLPLASKDVTREILRGVLVKPSLEPGFVELHVTDGHKAVIEKVKASVRDLPDKGILVPSESLASLKAMRTLVPSGSIASLKAMTASLKVSKHLTAEPDGYILDTVKDVLTMDVRLEAARHLALPVSLELAKNYPNLRQVISVSQAEKPNTKLGISAEYLAEIVKAYKGKAKNVSLNFRADKEGRCLSPVTVGVQGSDFAENAEIVVMPVRV